MSGLQDFLAPFSHLLFANRDKAIVVLGIVLGWFTIQLLIARWRNERLQRDLAAAQSGSSGSSPPRHAPRLPGEEAPAESGALPPVKGGRTYARNLGTALSKAGISSSQQIYSPPSPQGWAPSLNAGQPGMGQPPQGAPYAPPNTPWGAPVPQQQAPWGFPGGPGRPPQSPGQVPFYQPQAPQPQQQPAPLPPMGTPPSAPGFYGAPSVPPFSHPAFAPATSGPAAAPAPPISQPATPPTRAAEANRSAVASTSTCSRTWRRSCRRSPSLFRQPAGHPRRQGLRRRFPPPSRSRRLGRLRN